jgi:TonB family protein
MLPWSSHMRSRVYTVVASLFVATLVCSEAMGQQYPPYTLVTRLTQYDANGETVRVTTHTRYQSSSGDWRVVSKSDGGEQASLYRRGRGVFQSDSRTSRIIKSMDHAPGCPIRTGEQLRQDRKFARTEEVLGFTAYVWIENPAKDLVVEHYYVPELGGGTPFKQVTTYKNGPKFVSEPLSVTRGEPPASDVTGPDYLVVDQAPVFVKNIAEHLRSKPDPDYPTEALVHGWSGVVRVMVTVDETGAVISAGVLDGFAPQSLRDAAAEAAYKASFKPVIAEGKIVVAKGILDYRFVWPK